MSRRRPHHASSGAPSAQQQQVGERDNPTEDNADRSSVRSTSTQASTIATTASLASRLAVLNLDFAGERAKAGEGGGDLHSVYEASILEGSESAFDEDGEVTERADDDDPQAEPGGVPLTSGTIVLHSPMPRLPPFQICSRLFTYKPGQPVVLKRLTIQQCEELRLNGYTIMDGLVSRELASQVRQTVVALHRKGRLDDPLKAAAQSGLPPDTCYPDRVARSDQAMWLTTGRPPADSWPLSNVLVVLQEVYEDLAQFVRVRRQACEYQVSMQPSGSSGMSRHRDAWPDSGTSATASAAATYAAAVAASTSSASASASLPPPHHHAHHPHAHQHHPHLTSRLAATSSTGNEGAAGGVHGPGGGASASAAHLSASGSLAGVAQGVASSSSSSLQGQERGQHSSSGAGTGPSSSSQHPQHLPPPPPAPLPQHAATTQSEGPSARQHGAGSRPGSAATAASHGSGSGGAGGGAGGGGAGGQNGVQQQQPSQHANGGTSQPNGAQAAGQHSEEPAAASTSRAAQAAASTAGGGGSSSTAAGGGGGAHACSSQQHSANSSAHHGPSSSQLPASGSGGAPGPIPPHLLPRRLTCIVCCTSEWERDHGGVVRIWPPRRGLVPAPGGGGAAAAGGAGAGAGGGPGHRSGAGGGALGGRRSLTGSEAGLSQVSNDDARSDTFSLRSYYLANFGAASVTSSMWAELGAHEADAASVDGSSMADINTEKEERPGVEWSEVEGETVVDVAPLGGRMLLFLSGAVEHAISPAATDVASVTAWF